MTTANEIINAADRYDGLSINELLKNNTKRKIKINAKIIQFYDGSSILQFETDDSDWGFVEIKKENIK